MSIGFQIYYEIASYSGVAGFSVGLLGMIDGMPRLGPRSAGRAVMRIHTLFTLNGSNMRGFACILPGAERLALLP